jgi:tetratricopeptide (TPR) repeat protein
MNYNIFLASLVLAVGARAEIPTSGAVAVTAESAIERAFLVTSATQLADAVKPLEAALAADPQNPALLYERAFAHYGAAIVLRPTNNKDAMLAEFNQAIALLGRVTGAPWEAEADALHGTILGELITLKGGMSGMTLGPKASQLLTRAAKASPNNPRVLLFRGIGRLNTPAMFGGDSAEGMKLLQQSVDGFAKADASAPGPQWGRANALTWLGIAKQRAGDANAARAAWMQALALEPENSWVKLTLLPSLDRKQTK